MKSNLSGNITNSERKENTILAKQFIKAFLNKDYDLLESLLSYEFTYLTGLSKWDTLDYLNEYWKLLNDQKVEIEIEECISMDYFPGCVAYRFRFKEFMGGENFPSRLTIVPTFKDGQIIGLIISKRFAPRWALKRLTHNN